MESSIENSPELERTKDKEKLTPEEVHKKRLALKVQKMKMMKNLNAKRPNTSSGLSMAAVYEMRLKKLRKNNRTLAKALTDQRMENQQWYTEVIGLKAQLQEANERLLKSNDENFEKILEQEVDRRFKEIGEPLNQAISQAMENLLVVVENFSKVKQLANMRRSISRSSSSSSSSSFSFPRPLASRAPLSSCNNTSSPRQSVRPMVSGHVLQPAMVAIQKLDDVWKARVKERIQAREDALDMSTIAENSTVSSEENNSSVLDNEISNTSQQAGSEDTNIASNDVATESTQSVSPRNPRRSSQRNGRNGRNSGIHKESEQSPSNEQSPPPPPTPPIRVVSPTVTLPVEETPKPCDDDRNQIDKSSDLEHIEDPLEGPSWWYGDSVGRGRGRGRGRVSRGSKRGRPRSSSKSDFICPVDVAPDVSSESEEEESSNRKTKNRVNTSITINDGRETKTTHVASPKPGLDRSYLASPMTMLSKLEELEARGGRRSKSKSRGRSLRISGFTIDNSQNQHCRISSANVDESLNLALSDSVLSSGNQSLVSETPEKMSEKEPSVALVPGPQSDYLIKDTDLTCIGDMSMDMTEPISKILGLASEYKKGSNDEGSKILEKKFFKKVTSQSQKSENAEKTPFDLSLMDATYIAKPPFSSQKSVEKENMPPDSRVSDEKDLNLRRVSIVLEDFMKPPSPKKNISPMVENQLKSKDLDKSPEKVKHVPRSGEKRNSRAKKTISMVEDNFDISEEDDTWSPGKNKRRKSTQKSRQSSVSKGNVSGRGKNLTASRKSRERRNKSETDFLSKTRRPSVNEGDADMMPSEVITKEKDRHSVGVSPVFDDAENYLKDVTLNDCFVKICRTPLKELRKSVAPEDDCCLLINNKPDIELPMLYENLSSVTAITAEDLNSHREVDHVDALHDMKDSSVNLEPSVPEPCDQVVPEQEVRPLSTEEGTDIDSNTTLSDAEINTNRGYSLVGKRDVDKIPDTFILPEEQVVKDKIEKEVESEVEVPRKRRATAKIISFKEPSLNKKMRRQEGDFAGFPSSSKTSRRSGRKSAS